MSTVTKTAVTSTHLDMKADSDVLVQADTYDVTRIELVVRDQNNTRLPFANDSGTVTVKGPAKLIGPQRFPLDGGCRAFWIRTTGGTGKITVTADSAAYGKQSLELYAK